MGYPRYKQFLEQLQDDGVLRDDILKYSLFYSDFNYSNMNAIRMMQENLESKRYNKFISLFSEKYEIIDRDFYNKLEKEFLDIGEQISEKEDIVYNIEKENDEREKIIKKLEKKSNQKKEIEAVLKKIANKTTELNETVKNREAVKQKIESNIENVELQNDLRNLTVEELRISKEIEEYKIKIEELKLSSDSSEIDRLRTKIKEDNQKKDEIRTVITNERNQKDEFGRELSKYEENLIASPEEIKEFFLNVKYLPENIRKSIVLAVKSDVYDNFKTVMDSNKDITADKLKGVKEEWIFTYFSDNQEELIKLKDGINRENYSEYKRTFEYILGKGSKKVKIAAVDIMLANEDDYLNKITAESIEMQGEAIKRYGISKSIEYFNEKLKDGKINDIVLSRGLVLAGDSEINDYLIKRYEESKKIEYLENIFIIKNSITREYVKDKITQLSDDDKIKFLNKSYIAEMEESVPFVFDIITSEKSSSARIIYLDYISKYNREQMIKAVLKLMEMDNISAEERTFIISKLREKSGEDTTYQILKSLEKGVYSSKIEEEKEKVAFSAKIEFWNAYLKEFPDSLFKEEILKKISIYEARVETIKASIKSDYKIQMEQIDKKITEYKEYIKDQTDLGRIGYFQGKIKDLEKKKLIIVKNSQKSIVDTIKDLEKNYKNISDEVQGVKVYLNSKSSDVLTREERERERLELNKLMVRQAEILEKIAILYGFYLEENKENRDKEILDKNVLRDLKGNR